MIDHDEVSDTQDLGELFDRLARAVDAAQRLEEIRFVADLVDNQSDRCPGRCIQTHIQCFQAAGENIKHALVSEILVNLNIRRQLERISSAHSFRVTWPPPSCCPVAASLTRASSSRVVL